MEPVINLRDVSVRYRVPKERIPSLKEYAIRWLNGRRVEYMDFWALHDVNLEVHKGEVLGIIGQNGAGKSTLLKVIARVMKPTKGHVRVMGKVAPLLELGAGFDWELTGRENIYLNGAILGFSRREMDEKFERIVDFAELWDFIDAPLRTYSTGMVARLGFAIATDVNPDILLIDEVLAVGDERFQKKCIERINGFMNSQTTIVLVSHNMDLIHRMCDRAVWLEKGLIQAVGEVNSVVSSYLDFLQRREGFYVKARSKPLG
jgi:ABC-2 type transport system ATP-binding protein/lipopolysaccharide transport system ATP-binding protein